LKEGYAPVEIKRAMQITYKKIRKYAKGDPALLCKRNRNANRTGSQLEKYRNEIIDMLKQGIVRKDIYKKLKELGCFSGQTAFYDYCKILEKEDGIEILCYTNSLGIPVNKTKKIKVRYIDRKDIFKYLWSGKEMDQSDIDYLFEKYPVLNDTQKCIGEFRNIFTEKSVKILNSFIDDYSKSQYNNISSFANGLKLDKDAVINAIESDLSNGFVEGLNNKVKAIKRVMYGRAGIKLLSAKVIYARTI